ncbi:MAG: Uma2 family endonuclease, partial [Anaerolinea sp.]|nr:Uma2 family endonuclease [Anaerolinea sp.]
MTANEQIQSARITEEDLIRLGSQDQSYEVTDGELVPKSPIGFEHSLLTFRVAKLLDAYVAALKLGYVHPDGLICVLAHNPDGGMRVARVPDVCFIRRGRLPKDFDLKRPFPGAPDLAIEISGRGHRVSTRWGMPCPCL